VGSILEQLVTSIESRASFKALVKTLGEPAPGPAKLLLPVAPERLARTAAHHLFAIGVEARRAKTLRFAASRAERLEETVAMTFAEAQTRLRAFPGIGAWTAAEVAFVALGDPDCVSVGDYHLKNTVAWTLAGVVRGTDERMLELLAPYAGHRGRVARLLGAGGLSAPAFGPRRPLRRATNSRKIAAR
jgi:3-methyladenine DNA glycosylase/8-oxoguanine DNA glycosylase